MDIHVATAGIELVAQENLSGNLAPVSLTRLRPVSSPIFCVKTSGICYSPPTKPAEVG